MALHDAHITDTQRLGGAHIIEVPPAQEFGTHHAGQVHPGKQQQEDQHELTCGFHVHFAPVDQITAEQVRPEQRRKQEEGEVLGIGVATTEEIVEHPQDEIGQQQEFHGAEPDFMTPLHEVYEKDRQDRRLHEVGVRQTGKIDEELEWK